MMTHSARVIARGKEGGGKGEGRGREGRGKGEGRGREVQPSSTSPAPSLTLHQQPLRALVIPSRTSRDPRGTPGVGPYSTIRLRRWGWRGRSSAVPLNICARREIFRSDPTTLIYEAAATTFLSIETHTRPERPGMDCPKLFIMAIEIMERFWSFGSSEKKCSD